MTTHQIEIFTGNCPLCDETVALIKSMADPAYEITVCNLGENRQKAEQYGVKAVPAIAIDGVLIFTGKQNQSSLEAIGIYRASVFSGAGDDLGWGI
ncbi:thioredoxin family protein [Chroococcus sp. FPU101]|uniref:thioredoxin family protein n=1 Tax=Chroococcus sp. FPU101 TaxID=1974212 RepID=UPI001A8EDC8F|nr:thioredoxin family protein [Chroococcus sp. FPU101]GFE69114.1 thioredoxin [Chroococcus sp. FPU101]